MHRTEYPRGEIARLGAEIYQRNLRAILEPVYKDKFAVINVETGEYVVDEDHLTASNRADEKWPIAPLYAVRIGHKAVGRLGGSFRRVRR